MGSVVTKWAWLTCVPHTFVLVVVFVVCVWCAQAIKATKDAEAKFLQDREADKLSRASLEERLKEKNEELTAVRARVDAQKKVRGVGWVWGVGGVGVAGIA